MDMIIAVDSQRQITEFNRAAELTLGYRKKEVLGKHVDMIYADISEGQSVHKSTLEKGKHLREIMNKRKNGETFPALIAASTIFNNKGESIGVMGVSRDISEQKAAEMVLRDSEEKFRSIFEESRDAIYISSAEGYTVDFNLSMERMLGYDREALLNLPVKNVYAIKETRLQFQKFIEAQGYVKDYELQFRKKDGLIIDCLVSATVRNDRDGNLIGYQGIIRDISESKQAEKDREEALQEARKANKVKSLFLANMSHEIRTPLTAILGFIELIEDSTHDKVSKEEKGFFEIIRRSGDRLMHTVHSILDISQIEAGTYKLKRESLDLVNLVQDLINEYQLMVAEKNLKLEYESDLDSAFIMADKNSLSGSFSNILDNAIKYTDQGKIIVSIELKSNQYVLSFKDTGIGISKEYLGRLYDAFAQESEGYNKKYQGIGLGMALAKLHLDMNQVEIDVESTKDVGTTFILTFKPEINPVRKKEMKRETTKVLPVDKPTDLLQVLFVEDDPNTQKLINIYLKEQYTVCFADSVANAKQQLKEQKVNLVLLDLSLKGNEDGLDLARFIRKSKQWKTLPIIAATAHAFTSDRDNCIAAGCDDYLSKPVKKENLLEKISKFV